MKRGSDDVRMEDSIDGVRQRRGKFTPALSTRFDSNWWLCRADKIESEEKRRIAELEAFQALSDGEKVEQRRKERNKRKARS